MKENGIAGSHQLHLKGYILRALSMPGVYDRKMARAVSKSRAKFSFQFFMPWSNTESLLVLQMMTSVHWTITIEMKKAV